MSNLFCRPAMRACATKRYVDSLTIVDIVSIAHVHTCTHHNPAGKACQGRDFGITVKCWQPLDVAVFGSLLLCEEGRDGGTGM